MTNYGIRSMSVMLALALLLAACSKKNAPGAFPHASLDPSLEKFVASDTLALLDVRLGSLRSTPLYARHRNELQTFAPEAANELVLAWDGKRLLVLQKENSGAIRLGGDPKAVTIARRTAKNGGDKLSEELAASLRDLPGSAQVWAVSRGLPLQGVPLPSQYASLLSNFRGYLRNTGIALQAGNALHLTAQINCFSEAGSRRVYDALRAGIAFARLSNQGKDAFAASLWEQFRVERAG